MQKIILGITGSIAAIRVPELIRALPGYDISCLQTPSSKEFVSPLALSALTGHPARSDWEENQGTSHITVARHADLCVIAPASANCLAKLALGIADNFFYSEMLAFQGTTIVVPAMNPAMWNNPATQNHVGSLKSRGFVFLDPQQGTMICQEVGVGKMASVPQIVSAIHAHFTKSQSAGNKPQLVISYGATRAMIDPVRFISNGSTGAMGVSLLKAAQTLGFAPLGIAANAPDVPGCPVLHCSTNDELQAHVENNLKPHSWYIGCAAVTDFRLTNINTQKVPKNQLTSLVIEPSQDIIATLARPPGSRIIGFCCESASGEELIRLARQKQTQKKLDGIVANSASAIGAKTWEGFVLIGDKKLAIESTTKDQAALQILNCLWDEWKS